MSPEPGAVQKKERSEFAAFGECGRVFIAVFFKSSDARTMRTMRERTYAMNDLYPDGFATLTVVGGSVMKLDPETRKESELISKAQLAGQRGSAIVIEGKGFVGAAIRALIAGILAFSPTRNKIFESTESAVAWLKNTVPGADAEALSSAVLQLREGS